MNSAIAQAYYAKKQGLKGVTTETGAGQWGTALSMACSYLGLDCKVFMVKCSYEQKPFRREVMRTYGASVTPSPSMETEVGRKILAEHPGTTGSLGCAISEAVEVAVGSEGYRYVLGSVLNQVVLHQSVIGVEANLQWINMVLLRILLSDVPEGGSNLGGLISPFMGEKLRGEKIIISLQWSRRLARVLQEVYLHMISVTPVWCVRWRRCTHWEVDLFRRQIMREDFVITE